MSSSPAQFPNELVVGFCGTSTFSKNFSSIRLSGKLHIPGDYIDFESDIVSSSFVTDNESINDVGIGWLQLIPTLLYMSKERISFLEFPSLLLLGVNGLFNCNFSMGNKHIRAFAGWNNDFYLFRNFLWTFQPGAGIKIATPEGKHSYTDIRAGIVFPAYVYKNRANYHGNESFRPKLLLSVNIFALFADISLAP